MVHRCHPDTELCTHLLPGAAPEELRDRSVSFVSALCSGVLKSGFDENSDPIHPLGKEYKLKQDPVPSALQPPAVSSQPAKALEGEKGSQKSWTVVGGGGVGERRKASQQTDKVLLLGQVPHSSGEVGSTH